MRRLSHAERMELERQHNEELEITRHMMQQEEQRKAEYKTKKEQERKKYEHMKELEREKENARLKKKAEEMRRADVLRQMEEWNRRAEEMKRRIQEEQMRIEYEKLRRQEEERRIQEEQRQQLQRNQTLQKELSDLRLKYPDETYRWCVLKLCKKYHPDKNPNADPEYIRILNDMK